MSSKKLVVYTVVFGGYDKVLPILNPSDNVDYFVVSDKQLNLPLGWELILIDSNSDLSFTELNRLYKMKPNILFGEYEFSLYIDGNIELVSKDIYNISMKYLNKYNIALYTHPERNSVREESLLLSHLGFDYFFNIKKQYLGYLNQGFIDSCLYECNILFRRHNCKVFDMMDSWHTEFNKGIKRDQISFTYSAWKNQVIINNIGKSDARYDHIDFVYHLHVKKNKNKNNFKKIINRFFMKLFGW
ncbi:hypothetical protein C5F63_17795 [Photobacterium damselae subsp. damselae]|uniref:glycosyltransferase domain-containing protein n=1 Tax=Photobacterium damselae TaxID=38293 RepID=UPI000D0544D7|nr:glycosyltransferase domain-containing protein [Photobacterium damselae]PSB83909.1 hypothetical protein C5F63_17795 [Photobacterium damselae subsp. damselae]